MRKNIKAILAVAAIAIAIPSCTNGDSGEADNTADEPVAASEGEADATGDADPASEGEGSEVAAAEAGDAELGRGPWTCYSRRKCGGKVLNHKDPHNCKNSGGKSDYNSITGVCHSPL